MPTIAVAMMDSSCIVMSLYYVIENQLHLYLYTSWGYLSSRSRRFQMIPDNNQRRLLEWLHTIGKFYLIFA